MRLALRKVKEILKETFHLVRRHKLYFLVPLLVFVAVVAILFYQLGTGVVVSFIYAGL